MQNRSRVQHLMPLMREFGSLERERLGAGVTPLEFQRWLDLKGQIGRNFASSRAAGLSAMGGQDPKGAPSRLLVSYKTRAALLDSLFENIRPVGLFVATPFAAEVGTRFLLRVSIEREGETADMPGIVVTSISQGANTLSTMSMGMGVKLERPKPSQAADVSRIFAHALDAKLGLPG